MRTREEQEAINKACKYHPTTKAELQKLVNDKRINLGNVDTSQITDMSYLFEESKRTDFSGIETWDTSNVTDMSNMFYGCKNFNEDISAWDVSSVKNMRSMFYACENFKQDLNAWCVREDCNVKCIFEDCEKQTYDNVKMIGFSKTQLKQLDPLGEDNKFVKGFKEQMGLSRKEPVQEAKEQSHYVKFLH